MSLKRYWIASCNRCGKELQMDGSASMKDTQAMIRSLGWYVSHTTVYCKKHTDDLALKVEIKEK